MTVDTSNGYSGELVLHAELGVIGEYIWRIFEMLSAKPEAIIEDAYM
jgi:hypothetical protein